MTNNIVDQIGSTVTVWCNDGNGMENRKLLTIDTFGIVVIGYGDWEKAVFIPWCQVKYVDYPNRSNKVLAGDPAIAKNNIIDPKNWVYPKEVED